MLLDSRLMVGAVRLCGLAVAVYLLLSVLARVRRGQWLSAVGPFQVDASVQKVTAESNRLEAELVEAKRTIDAQTEGEVATVTEAAKREAIEEARRVVADATKESRRIGETIKESREVREQATKVLRRAGYRVSA